MSFLLIVSFSAAAQLQVGDWKLYNVFSGKNAKNIIDTGNIVYYLSDGCLFSYDEENEETILYNKRNDLSDNDIKNIYYNYDKNYLLIVYTNSNMDFLYDSGRVVNFPDLKNASISESKNVNSADFQEGEVYIATDFGYMVVDDERHLIKESFNYKKQFKSIVATDKYIYACFDKYVWVSEKSAKHFYISSFVKTNRNFETDLKKIDDNTLITGSGWCYLMAIGDDMTKLGLKEVASKSIRFLSKSKDGFCLSFDDFYMKIDKEGNILERLDYPDELKNSFISSMQSDGSVWCLNSRGIGKFKIDGEGTVTFLSEIHRPNVTTVNRPAYLSYENDRLYSMTTGSNTFLANTNTDFGLSYMMDGTWKDLAPTEVKGLVNKNSNGKLMSPFALTVDPDDPETVWFGSWWEGTFAVKNNEQIQKFDNTNSPLILNYICTVTDMKFDNDKNLWMLHSPFGGVGPALMALPADKRFSEVAKSDWTPYYFSNISFGKHGRMIITKDNKILIANNSGTSNKTYLIILDTNGTIDDKTDDRQSIISSFVDQDNKSFDIYYLYDMFEDVDGKIWLATNKGVAYLNKADDLFNEEVKINRVKVPRNDGTNLADYLLDGMSATCITADGSGRKWIGTVVSGVYLVSEDGSEVLSHYTSDNSYLPSDMVYDITCNTNNNSVYIGTEKGLAEFSSDAMPAENDFSKVYAYPNPVRPDYTGYITVKGLMENTLVKIADAAGNVVYSGRSNGGMFVWDGCNTNGKRVDTGVYFVFASKSDDSSSEGCVTKILIVR